MFQIGQKVVCVIEGRRFLTSAGEVTPQKGGVYTVREVIDGGAYVQLREVVNQPRRYDDGTHECCFTSKAFRPVVERKTDISIFTEMLTPSKVEA